MSLFVPCECGQLFETSEANAGRRTRCPECGRELIVPMRKPAPPDELLLIPEPPEQAATSGKAVASVVVGLVFFFGCLTGLPAILLGRDALRDIDRSGGRLRGRGTAIAGIVLGVFGCLFTIMWFLPAVRSAREAARRSQCVNNLKQIGLAMHNYYGAHGMLPPAAITGKDGRPLLSWRVALLPYLEGSALFASFHLDEPWDSPHNRPLLDAMPLVYACPSDLTRKPGMTGYQAVIGPDTAFPPDFTPLRLADFTDGVGETLLVGESRRNVPWTMPEDLPFDMDVPLTGLGSHHGYHNNGLNALFVDGSVRFLKSSIQPNVLGAILTRNRGDVVSQDKY